MFNVIMWPMDKQLQTSTFAGTQDNSKENKGSHGNDIK